METLTRVWENIKDVQTLGPRFLLRHMGRIHKDRISVVPIPGVGPFALRAGESDTAAVRQVFVEKQYDTSWPEALGERISKRYRDIRASGGKPIIVDAGANIGAASAWFAMHYPEAFIVAIEPDPGNVKVLERNFGHAPNHVVIAAAIGAKQGFVSLLHSDMSWTVRTKCAPAGVPMITVEDAFAASGGDTPFIVKIDIEGFERELFSSNLDWIERCFMIVIEPHDWLYPGQLSSRTFQQELARHPFEIFMRGENLFYVRV